MRTYRFTCVVVAAVVAQSFFASRGAIASDQIVHLAKASETLSVLRVCKASPTFLVSASHVQATCPAIEDVSNEVFSATGRRPSEQSIAWKLLPDRASLRVTLLDIADGSEFRDVAVKGQTCKDLAKSVAVIWVGAHLTAMEFAVETPEFPETPVVPPVAPSSVRVEDRVAVGVSMRPSHAESAPVPKEGDSQSDRFVDVDASALSAWSGANPAVSVGGGIAVGTDSAGVRADIAYTSAMREPLGPGHAEWQRWTLSLGLDHKWIKGVF